MPAIKRIQCLYVMYICVLLFSAEDRAGNFLFYLDLIISLSLSYCLMADGFLDSVCWKWIKEWEGKK